MAETAGRPEPDHDQDLPPMTGGAAEEIVRSTRRFDLRRILGALFVLYGVIVTIVGIVHFNSDLDMTGGIHINLWTGLAMLVGGLLFFLWDRLAPVPAEDIVNNLKQQKAELEAQD